MPDSTITGLSAVTAPSSTDVVAIVNAGSTKKTTIANLVANSNPASLAISGLTSGRVTYAGTSGLLSDDSGFTYNSATHALTTTTFVGALTGNASTASNLSGTPALPNGTTATTQSQADGSTKLATTAYADTLGATKQATITFGTGVQTALGVNVGSAGAPVLFNGAGGTPSSMVGTNITGTASGLTAGIASAVAVGGITGLGTGVATALAVNVGSAGAFLTFNGNAGTPSALVGTNISGTAASLTAGTASAVAVGGITGLGTGVATALAINVGSAGAPVTFNGAGGTPSSLTGTNISGTAASLTAGSATILANARTIGGVSFNGSANITVASATGGFAVTGGSLTVTSTASNALSVTNSAADQFSAVVAHTGGSTHNFGLEILAGTGSSDYALYVRDSGNANTLLLVKGDGSVLMPGLASSSAATTGTLCWTTGTGNVNVDTTTTCLLSSAKYKKWAKPLDLGLEAVLKLRPVSYLLKKQYDIGIGRQVGFFAEDVVEVDRRLVSLEEDGSPHAVRYQQLTAVLASAIQEQHARYSLLEARFNTLWNQVNA